MIFRKIGIENFGIYRGYQEINVASESDEGKPIVLIGGKNGTGKSTILEAVKLALHGKLALGNRISQRKYREYLYSRIHRYNDPTIDVSRSSVEVELQCSFGGRPNIYRIKRIWERNRKNISESFVVEKNGRRQNSSEEGDWEYYLRRLIPFHLSELFFLDGQKIDNLSQDVGSDELGEAIQSLLGLRVLNRLHQDLDVYITKQDKGNPEEIQSNLENLIEEREDVKNSIKNLEEKQKAVVSKIEDVEAEVWTKERKFIERGGNFAERRETLKEDKIQLEARIEELKEDIRSMCKGILPFTLSAPLAQKVKSQLEKERKIKRIESVREHFKNRASELRFDLLSSSFWEEIDVPRDSQEKVINNIIAKLESLDYKNECSEDASLVHCLSGQEERKVLHNLERALEKVPSKFYDYVSRLNKATNKLKRIKKNLREAPSQDEIKPLFDEIREYEERRASLRNRREELYEQISSQESKLEDISRRVEKLREMLLEKEELDNRLKTAKRVGDVLREYKKKLIEKKLEELERAIVRNYNQLSGKEMLSRVSIDSQNFTVVLDKMGGRKVPQSELSQGESQLYAISVLRALWEVSSSQLPLIIDEPLGHLDKDNRESVFRNYLLTASHQLVLLSTDTEIGQKERKKLEPSVAKSYRLKYNPDNKCTKVLEGYF